MTDGLQQMMLFVMCAVGFADQIHSYSICVVWFSAELPQPAAPPHTGPVTHLCLIRGSLQENIVEPALVDSRKDDTFSLYSLTYSLPHPQFLMHVALPQHPTQSPLPASLAAYCNVRGKPLSGIPQQAIILQSRQCD